MLQIREFLQNGASVLHQTLLATAWAELASILQSLMDNNGGGGCSVLLILCGSYMGFMEKAVLGEKSPLFGRRSGQIFLQPCG